MNHLNKDILITVNVNGFYLLYNNDGNSNKDNYILFSADAISRYSCTESPKIYDDLLDNMGDVFDENKLPNDLRVIYITINANVNDADASIKILRKLFMDLADVHFSITEENDITGLIKRIDAIDDERIIERIETISKQNSLNARMEKIADMYNAFKTRKGVKKAIRDLGNYMNKEMGVILRKRTHTPYILNDNVNGYDSTDIDELIIKLSDTFNEDNLFSTKDIEDAISYISDRKEPEYNIIKFKNGLYDIKQHTMIKPDKPIFTLVESPYNYNPDAKGEDIQNFLESVFERETPEETERIIKGFLQVMGYLFTSGNDYNVMIFFTGVSGAGKGTMISILSAIFSNKICNVDIKKLNKDQADHKSSAFVNAHLNLVAESSEGVVYDISIYKTLSGNDAFPINPKYKPPYLLPKEAVPKTVDTNNNLPNFTNPDRGLYQRFIVVEFKNFFRNTTNDIKGLADILINSTDDMEWLIYHGLEAYKEMVESNEDFELRLSENKTAEILYKHSKPLHYLIDMLISKHDKTAYDTEIAEYETDSNNQSIFTRPYIVANEFRDVIMYLAEKEGVQLKLENKSNKVNPTKVLDAIRDEFDLHDYYLTTRNGSHKKYTAIPKRIGGTVKKIYPELIKTEYYRELLEEMMGEETLKDEKEADKSD